MQPMENSLANISTHFDVIRCQPYQRITKDRIHNRPRHMQPHQLVSPLRNNNCVPSSHVVQCEASSTWIGIEGKVQCWTKQVLSSHARQYDMVRTRNVLCRIFLRKCFRTRWRINLQNSCNDLDNLHKHESSLNTMDMNKRFNETILKMYR